MISVQNSLFQIVNTILFFMLVVVVVAVVVLVAAAAATMLSNKISLQVTWDWEQLHLQHFFLEHKFYFFWHYKATVGGTALHPCNYFWTNTFTTYTLLCLHLQIRRRQKYDVQLPAWCNIYLCLHFVMVVFVYQELVLRYMVSTFQQQQQQQQCCCCSLVTGLFFLVLLLNHWCSPPLRLQVSDCSTLHIMCDVPSMIVFCSEYSIFSWYAFQILP